MLEEESENSMDKSKLSLPIFENWIAFKQDKPCRGHYEYEMFSDAIISGENTKDFGPYQFLNPCNRNKGVRTVLVFRYDDRLPDYTDRTLGMNTTDVNCYHGGGLEDEVAAILSLTMGVRMKAGRMIREFSPLGDNFGRPVGWHDSFVPYIKPEYGRYRLPSVIRESNIALLGEFNKLSELSESGVAALIKAARLYQQALWIAESDPSLSWIMFVSALETAAQQWKRERVSNVEKLKFAKTGLYDYLTSLKSSGIVERVADFLSDSMGATKNFVDFVMTFAPVAPDRRPSEYMQCSWKTDDLERTMKIIYDYRSRALHGGTPFPFPMCVAPYYDKEQNALSEKPPGLGCYANSGKWTIDDTPMLLNTFEYIARNCLLKWWEQLN